MVEERDVDPMPSSDRRVSPRDKWWFSPMLQVVAGGAIIGFQLGPISGGTAKWLNWIVALLGLTVLVWGAVSWFRAWREQS